MSATGFDAVIQKVGRNAMVIAPRKWTVNATARGVEEKAVCRGPLDGSTARNDVRPHIRTAADAGAEKEAGLGRSGLFRESASRQG